MADRDEDEARVTFRIPREDVKRLDDLIKLNQVHGPLDDDTSRSDLLRNEVQDLIEELEGNSPNISAPAD